MPPSTKIILACDESGAKGYSDQDEKFDGEVGVFAGVLIPEELLFRVLPDFQKVYDRYVPSSGKFHIADLPLDRQGSLRHDVYSVITKHKLPCFWYAVHVAGFHDFISKSNASVRQAKKVISNARPAPRVKRSSPRSNLSSLHVTLFSGLYANIVAFLEERGVKNAVIEVRSDRIDKPILKEAEKAMGDLLDETPTTRTSSGFDTVSGKVVYGSITTEITYPPELQIDIKIDEVVLNSASENDPFVLAADVLANSLNHLFQTRPDEEKYNDLNHPTAVRNHPLSKSLDPFEEWGLGDVVGDRLFRHPKAPPFEN